MADGFPERLNEERKAALAELQERLSTWKTFQTDYKSLEETLKFLPGKVSHDVMVPFGSLAFMPGKLIHTNEILVLLGDNWFAERSASQAVEIVKRRQESMDENIKAINNEIDFFTSQLNFAQDMNVMDKGQNDIVEIKEELQEDDKGPGRGPRVAHEKAKDFAPKRVKKFGSHSLRDNLSHEDKDLFAKLEAQERINEELKPTESDEEQNDNDNKHMIDTNGTDYKDNEAKLHSDVSFSHEIKTESDDSDDSQGYEDLNTSKTIRVNFTKPKQETTKLPFAQDSINTPTDIYNKIKQKPKSILKTPSFEKETQEKPKSILKTPSFELETQETQAQPISSLHQSHHNEPQHEEKQSVLTAFSGKIIDRSANDAESLSVSQTTKSEPKRVSKFKAQRKK